MSLKFGQIQPLVLMVTDRVMIEIRVSTFSRLFFVRSYSYLQITMTCMRALMSSNFSLIGPLTAELAALKRLKKSPFAYNGKIMSLFFSGVFGRILFIFAGNDKIMGAWISLKFG